MASFSLIGEDVLFNKEYILKNLIIPKPENCPRIILLYGPCRSGTTALFKSFSEVVPVSYYQPIKNIMRYGEPQFFIENVSTIFVKETIGPWRDLECSYNPWSILLEAGVPIEKLSLIPILREPIKTYDSWLRTFDNVKIDNFLQSYTNFLDTYELAKEMNIEVNPIYYEKLKWDPNMMMRELIEKLNLDYQESVVDWSGDNSKISDTARISQKLQRDRIKEIVRTQELKYIDRPLTDISASDQKRISLTLAAKYDSYVEETYRSEEAITQTPLALSANSHLVTSSR